ncbi:MAG TPA: hypothetical protein VEV62_05700 [Parafilimonas sp.]|nr:hypothetical protein [Parafilimonas sp.]
MIVIVFFSLVLPDGNLVLAISRKNIQYLFHHFFKLGKRIDFIGKRS